MKKIFIIQLLGLLIFSSAQAQTPYYPSNYTTQNPREVVQTGVDRIQTFIASDNINNPALITSFLEKEMAPYFDFNAMSRMILGSLDYSLTAQQRTAVRAMIRREFLVAFAGNLSTYQGGQAQLMNVSGNLSQGRMRVFLRIYRQNKYPTVVELRLAQGRQGWKVYDVAANGLSAVAHYRNYIQSVVQRSGLQGLFSKS